MGSPSHPAWTAKGAALQRRALRHPVRLLAAPLLCFAFFGSHSVAGFKDTYQYHTGRSVAVVQPAKARWGQHYQEVMGLSKLPLLHLAGAVLPVIAANPFQVVKVQLQSASAPTGRSAPVAVARAILERDGIKGFFRGLSPALVAICPAILSHGLMYFMLKKVITRGAWSGERHGDLTELLCGSAAILAQNIVTNPIGMVQTRMQLGFDPAVGRRLSWREVVRSIRAGEGLGGFYKGLLASCLRCSENLTVFTLRGRLNRWLKARQVKRQLVQLAARKGLRWWWTTGEDEHIPEPHTLVPYMAIKLLGMIVAYPCEVVRTRQREQTSAIGLLIGLSVQCVLNPVFGRGIELLKRGASENRRSEQGFPSTRAFVSRFLSSGRKKGSGDSIPGQELT